MRDKVDFRIVKALLHKQMLERIYPYKRGNFDIIGLILRLLIVAAFATIFIVFFGKFTDIYMVIKTNNISNVNARVKELLTIAYTVLIIFMTIGAVGQINRQIFAADNIKLFSAMPVPVKSLYLAKLISIYLGQLMFSILAVAIVNLTMAAHVPQGKLFYLVTIAMCFLLPLITIAVASIFALPFYALKQWLSKRFALSFVIITLIAALLFYAYSVILGAVKELLLGDSLQYFFNEGIMNGIALVCSYLYPAKWIVRLLLGGNRFMSGLSLLIVLIVCLAVSMLIIRGILQSALQSRMSGSKRFIKRRGQIAMRGSGFTALVKKEFLLIFRTPSYMFSYFSVAVIMPLMVYTCMSIGTSLVYRLVGLNCNFELALFLTLLFGALTNVFCATNISRDGEMFYMVKAMPLSYKKVFFSKIFLCMIVTLLSQLASAVLLFVAGFVSVYVAALIFIIGTMFGFVYICVATRYDFNHAHFSTEEDGEIADSSGATGAIIIMGLLISFIVGGAVFVSRILLLLNSRNMSFLSFIIAGGAAVIFATIAYLYFIRRLGAKYYAFDGGNI